MWIIKIFYKKVNLPTAPKKKKKKVKKKQPKPRPGCPPEGAAVTSPSTRELYWHTAPLRLPSSGIPTPAFRETDEAPTHRLCLFLKGICTFSAKLAAQKPRERRARRGALRRRGSPGS